MTYTEQVRQRIRNKFKEAKSKGEKYIELSSRELHDELGFNSRFPIVCNAMRQLMEGKDSFIILTQSGQSSTITIRYDLTDRNL